MVCGKDMKKDRVGVFFQKNSLLARTFCPSDMSCLYDMTCLRPPHTERGHAQVQNHTSLQNKNQHLLMRAVIQRVSQAELTADGEFRGKMTRGLVVLLGIAKEDTPADVAWLVRKTAQLRIFNDEEGIMNKSVLDIGGKVMLVSQFTLHASTRKGNRPSYLQAAGHELAIPLYEAFAKRLHDEYGLEVITGIFGAHMEVSLLNDGPVTIIIDSKEKW